MPNPEMKAIACRGFGDAGIMYVAACSTPVPQAGEVLIKVAVAGVNRADILQRKGTYPPPAGASGILGIEASGTVAAIGAEVYHWKIGDKVCALLSGGGYADYVAVPASHCLRVPESLTVTEAALLPEAVATVYANVFEDAALKAGDTLLIHGGSSGIGTTAIQMAQARGARVFVTAGNADKCAACVKLGAELAVNYRAEDFTAAVAAATGGRGVDVVLDMVGGDYVNRNLSILAARGRHVSIATQRGVKADIDIGLVMRNRLTLTGSTLRGRDQAEKARLIATIEREVWPWVAAGRVKPVVFQTFSLKNANEAHKVMESGAHIGKIGLEVS